MRYQIARMLKDFKFADGTVIKAGTEGLICEEKEILRYLGLNEQGKHFVLGWFLDTRHDRFLVAFPNGKIMDFSPDDVETYWWQEVA